MSQPVKKHMPRDEALAKIRAWNAQTVAQYAEPGMTVCDSSIAIGLSPTTGQRIYAMPQDADVKMNFTNAVHYVEELNKNKILGHDDWHLPSFEELQLLYDLQNTGSFNGTFNAASKPDANPTDTHYWSSKTYKQKWLSGQAKSINFKNGVQDIRPSSDSLCVRVIR